MEKEDDLRIVLESATLLDEKKGVEELLLRTNIGSIKTMYHLSENARSAVVWISGALGGLDGPAGGLYPRLSRYLAAKGIASLRIDYRYPNQIKECILDTLLGIKYLLQERGADQIAIVGHSFGGAVAIYTAILDEKIVAIAALSSQLYGTDFVGEVSPRPLLLIHGMKDEILAYGCSEDIYKRAAEPKKIILYPECGHGLDECREQLDSDLEKWLIEKLTAG